MNPNALIARKKKTPFEYLFKPTSITVIGASTDVLKPGGRVFKTLVDHRFEGQLWPVNPKAAEILGRTAYPSIDKLPASPDLAIIAIPAATVVQALRELAERGTGAVIVLTSGFGEKNEAGKQAEQEMLRIARGAEMTLIGPNCSGFLTHTYKGKFAGMVPQLPGRAVDFISGSGATVDYVMEQAVSRGLSFGNVVNLGNSVMIGVEDLLAMYDENYDGDCARVLMLYMESVRKPQMLLRHARSLAEKGCYIVGIKSGATRIGERAAASHTGAMATSDTAVQALFDKAGIIRVKSKAEMINVACALVGLRGALNGTRACIVTDAGGPGVMLSDELTRQGWELPLLKDTTRRCLAAVLAPEASTLNPIDCLPSRTAEQLRAVYDILAQEEQDRIDVIVNITGDSGMTDHWSVCRQISLSMESCPIPILPVLASINTSRESIRKFVDSGKAFFYDEVHLGAALGKIGSHRLTQHAEPSPASYDRNAIAAALAGQTGAVPPHAVGRILSAVGFRLPEQREVFSREDLSAACGRIGFPLAMKVIGPVHKTDVGGVKLGIANDREALEAWDELMGIDGAEGVLLQPMIGGLEVIIGASREGDYGHLTMFGLGGIYAEVLKDVQFALAPLTLEESRRMVRGIRGHALLQGVRGQQGVSEELLADYIRRLGCLVSDFPRIREIDLNPVKGTGSDLFAVDARIILDS